MIMPMQKKHRQILQPRKPSAIAITQEKSYVLVEITIPPQGVAYITVET